MALLIQRWIIPLVSEFLLLQLIIIEPNVSKQTLYDSAQRLNLQVFDLHKEKTQPREDLAASSHPSLQN